MNELYEDIDPLIAKYFAAEINAAEKQALDAWLAEKPEHRQYFESLNKLWQGSESARPPLPRPIDTELALQKVKHRLGQGNMPVRRGGRIMRWWHAAAAIALIGSGAWFVWRAAQANPAALEIVADNAVLSDTLTDGSVVTLNRHTGLTIDAGFNQRTRKMTLRGEAFFEVRPDAAKPFIVSANGLEIQVVGTAFNVRTVADTVSVSVLSGKVLLRARQQEKLLMPGEQAVYFPAAYQLDIQPAQGVPAEPAYKSRTFVFEAAKLSTVCEQLESVYGVVIRLDNPALQHCRLTGRYNELSIDRILAIIADSFGFTVSRSADGVYWIRGEGCR